MIPLNKVEEAANRYIDPEEVIIGETSNTMYDYVPTTNLKGMEDFVEEKDYYNNFGEFDPIKVENYPREEICFYQMRFKVPILMKLNQ